MITLILRYILLLIQTALRNRTYFFEIKRKYVNLKPATIQRMKRYVNFMAVHNMWYSTLRGKHLDVDEERITFALAIATAVYDQLEDQYALNEFQILDRTYHLNGEGGDLLHIGRKAEDDFAAAKEKNEFSLILKKTKAAQARSAVLRGEHKLKPEEIISIAYQKGGFAQVLWRAALSNDMKHGEAEATMQVGFLSQMVNDVFGVYKDIQNKEQSLILSYRDMFAFRNYYSSELKKLIGQISLLPYPLKQKKEMMDLMLCAMVSAFVPLEQLCMAQKKKGESFVQKEYSRYELVCDMEKWRNRIRLIPYFRQWKKIAEKTFTDSE